MIKAFIPGGEDHFNFLCLAIYIPSAWGPNAKQLPHPISLWFLLQLMFNVLLIHGGRTYRSVRFSIDIKIVHVPTSIIYLTQTKYYPSRKVYVSSYIGSTCFAMPMPFTRTCGNEQMYHVRELLGPVADPGIF